MYSILQHDSWYPNSINKLLQMLLYSSGQIPGTYLVRTSDIDKNVIVR